MTAPHPLDFSDPKTRRQWKFSATGTVSWPRFERSEIEAHVDLLHDLAEGLDGVLMLVEIEEPHSRPQRFRIGDVAGMIEAVMTFDGVPGRNLYAPWAVMRGDIEPKKKGREADVIAVLAAVGDIDNDKYRIGELPIEAPYVIETSARNFQPIFPFSRPLEVAEAKPALAALCDLVGGDSGTKDASHIWRIPGTLNWPTKTKLARGRPQAPQHVRIAKHFDGHLIEPEALLGLAPLKPARVGSVARSDRTHDEARLADALAHIPADDRDIWLEVGMACHQTGTRELWDEWSRKSAKYDDAGQEKAWTSFRTDHPKPKTAASVYALARKHGWRPTKTKAVEVIEGPWPKSIGHDAEPYPVIEGPVTQDSVALVFAERYDDKLKYDFHRGKWFVWTGVYWRLEETELAYQYGRALARKMTGASSDKELKEARKSAFASGVERFARGDRRFAVTSEAWDRDPYLLGTPGGTVDLRTGELRPPNPADMITKQTAITPSETAACPLWREFLEEATRRDKDLIRFLRQWAGYCLTGVTKEHALFFAYGEGGNGKGVFVNTLVKIMGDYCKTAGMDTFMVAYGERHSTEIAKLSGARMVTATETEQGRTWAEAKINTLTGGDRVSARFMRQDEFEFTPTFKLTFMGNYKPSLRDVNDAARRRFNIVPFTNTPPEPDRELPKKLEAEWPGILRWALEGCLDWQANGLVRPACVLEATDEYFVEQNTFRQWLDEECVLRPGDELATETSADLFASWRAFAERAGEKPGTAKAFSARLKREGVLRTTEGHAKTRVYKHIRLIKPKAQQKMDV